MLLLFLRNLKNIYCILTLWKVPQTTYTLTYLRFWTKLIYMTMKIIQFVYIYK
jgi:hypothetical protein